MQSPSMKSFLAILTVITVAIIACLGHPVIAAATLLTVDIFLRSADPRGALQMPTLSATEIGLAVIRAFAKEVPAARLLGSDFRTGQAGGNGEKAPLKYNKTQIAHIAALPTAEAITSTYAVTGNNARNLLSDIPVLVDQRYGTRLYWENLYAIQDDKFAYERVIGGAGYALAKTFIDSLLAKARSEYFSQSSTFATADSDVDMLIDITGDMNGVGAYPKGRVMIVNTPVANALAAHDRMVSREFAGQQQGGDGIRVWRNTNGFGIIQEYPDFPSNNSTALTSVTVEADDDLFTKAAHGLVTGQRVCVTAITGGTGVTAGSYYFVIRVSATTFKLASTLALAIAGTGIDISLDGSSATITPAENLTGFATDFTGIQFLAGPEDHTGQNEMAAALGIPIIVGIENVTDPDSMITMSMVKWQSAENANINFMPVLLWGSVAGRQAGSNAIGAYTDYGGHLLRSA